MSYSNDSHKGGTQTKGFGKTKGGSGTKTGGNTKKGQHSTKAGQTGQHGQHGHANVAGTRTLQAQDIRSLVRNQGRANLGGQEWALKNPSWNDSSLQAIISDPKFTVKQAGKPAADGKQTYEIHGHGKTINVTIGR
jgi:hypothetical protein